MLDLQDRAHLSLATVHFMILTTTSVEKLLRTRSVKAAITIVIQTVIAFSTSGASKML